MTDEQIIIDDQKETIRRLQQECTEKTNAIIALGEQLKAKKQEYETLASQLDFEVQKKECLEQECDELKKTIMYKCPQCGEEYLSPIGASLYEENYQLKAENEELKKELDKTHLLMLEKQNKAVKYFSILNDIEEYLKLPTNVCLTDCPEYSIGQGCSQKCFENRLKILYDIIDKAKDILKQ